MESDLKSMNDELYEHDENPPNDLKMKQKVEDLHEESSHPQYQLEQELNLLLANVGGGFQHRFTGRRERDESNSRAQSSKRTRITKSPEPTDLNSSDSPNSELLKLVEEIVRIYSDYIDHIFQMAKDRFRDEQRWNFDQTMCRGLAESFSQKIERLGSELERMKKDLKEGKNYELTEFHVRQIMSQLMRMHERFHRSPNIMASSMKSCWKEELRLCIDEIDGFRKELYEIALRIRELKTMKMQKKTTKIQQRNLRII